MDRKNPTRIVETGRVVRGPSGQGVGWLQSLAERVRNVRAQLQGINDRLNTPFKHGVPAAVVGELTVPADLGRTITISSFPKDPDANPPVAFIALTVNPIILAGQTYQIPVQFSPPGVFMAHNLVVGVEAGFLMFRNFNRPGITPLNDYRQMRSGGGFVDRNPTADVIQYTWQQQVLGDFTTVMPFLPYFWNIIDRKSGRQYAQDWMPSGALLNTRANAPDSFPAPYPDSDLFEFDTPWLFERDAEVSFLFRPIMDLYQIAAGDSQFPYGFEGSGVNDLSGGRRTEQATVRVEFHGNRYYTAQDALKDGAFVTNSEPQRHPYNVNDPLQTRWGSSRRER